MAWSDAEERDNAVRIMRSNIDRHPDGSRLTPALKERAANFAVDAWKGQMGNGEAAKIGLNHVLKDIFSK